MTSPLGTGLWMSLVGNLFQKPQMRVRSYTAKDRLLIIMNVNSCDVIFIF